MRIDELVEKDGWLSKAYNTLMYGFKDPMEEYVAQAEKVLHRYGSQGTITHLQTKFPDADLIDLRRAVKQALEKTQDI
jgi:uncharacterized protein YbaA (DUF1428 family)